MLQDYDRRYCARVINEVSHETGVTKDQINSRIRIKKVVRARWIVMARLHHEQCLNYSDIGSLLGMDHTTVRHALETMGGHGAKYFAVIDAAEKQAAKAMRHDARRKTPTSTRKKSGSVYGR